MNGIKFLFAGLFLFFLLNLPAEIVKEDADSVTFRQPDRALVTVAKRPQRVVVGYASLAGVWHLADGTAVAVPDIREKSVLPESMRHLPAAGSATVPNVEQIVALKPDLVLLTAKLARHRATANLLRSSDIPAICVEYNHYKDFHALLDLFCRINGRSADTVAAAKKVMREVEQICFRTGGLTAPRCAVIFASSAGFSLESPLTNTGCMAAMLGAKNIRETESPARMPFSYEQFLLNNGRCRRAEKEVSAGFNDADELEKAFRREEWTRPFSSGGSVSVYAGAALSRSVPVSCVAAVSGKGVLTNGAENCFEKLCRADRDHPAACGPACACGSAESCGRFAETSDRRDHFDSVEPSRRRQLSDPV